jgi:hypothetical protein
MEDEGREKTTRQSSSRTGYVCITWDTERLECGTWRRCYHLAGCVWFEEYGGLSSFHSSLFLFDLWNEMSYHHLIPHDLIISICMRNKLVLLKFIGWTHDASPLNVWGDFTNQTHRNFLLLVMGPFRLLFRGCYAIAKPWALGLLLFEPNFLFLFVERENELVHHNQCFDFHADYFCSNIIL